MPTRPHDELLDHEYDGIREFDNPCPAWWHLIFIGSAAFALFYFMFFQLGTFGWTVADAYEAAVAQDVQQRFGEIGDLQGDQATLLTYMQDADWMSYAKTVFIGKCKSCHGEGGVGQVGPNLTDDHYKNVKRLEDVAHVIKEGAANGSMPDASKNHLHPNDVVLVAAYVAGLRGQNLPGPRGAEGEVIDPWPSAAEIAEAEASAKGTESVASEPSAP